MQVRRSNLDRRVARLWSSKWGVEPHQDAIARTVQLSGKFGPGWTRLRQAIDHHADIRLVEQCLTSDRDNAADSCPIGLDLPFRVIRVMGDARFDLIRFSSSSDARIFCLRMSLRNVLRYHGQETVEIRAYDGVRFVYQLPERLHRPYGQGEIEFSNWGMISRSYSEGGNPGFHAEAVHDRTLTEAQVKSLLHLPADQMGTAEPMRPDGSPFTDGSFRFVLGEPPRRAYISFNPIGQATKLKVSSDPGLGPPLLLGWPDNPTLPETLRAQSRVLARVRVYMQNSQWASTLVDSIARALRWPG